MLSIIIPAKEQYDDNTEEFITSKEQELQLEHSLISISKWESRWLKPFLVDENKTVEETIDYIRCMAITKTDPNIYGLLSDENIIQINEYIELDATATTFVDNAKKKNKRIITTELIYYWMIALNIPIKCEKWHLSRLLTLINVCNIENAPPKKGKNRDVLNKNAEINAARKKALNSKG